MLTTKEKGRPVEGSPIPNASLLDKAEFTAQRPEGQMLFLDKRAIVLDSIRRASLHARLMQNELDCIGISLKASWIDAECAVDWARDIGCHWLLDYLPTAVSSQVAPKAQGGVA